MIRLIRQRFEVLDILNRGGSAEHFFHFFFGILIPLVLYQATKSAKTLYFVRSCGPMNRFWRELNFDNLAIVEKSSIAKLGQHFPKTTLYGFDSHAHYDVDGFSKARRYILERLGMTNPISQDTETPSGVLMINRGQPDPYYNSSQAEIKGSGAQRRSIPNFRELADAFRQIESTTKVVRPELIPLRDQVRLFGNAKVVVMQHGSAIANIIWMKPRSKLIEIRPIPDWLGVSKLCRMFGIEHEVVFQESEQAPVDVAAIVAAAGKMQEKHA